MNQPIKQATSQPASQPASRPTSQPTNQPTSQPTRLDDAITVGVVHFLTDFLIQCHAHSYHGISYLSCHAPSPLPPPPSHLPSHVSVFSSVLPFNRCNKKKVNLFLTQNPHPKHIDRLLSSVCGGGVVVVGGWGGVEGSSDEQLIEIVKIRTSTSTILLSLFLFFDLSRALSLSLSISSPLGAFGPYSFF